MPPQLLLLCGPTGSGKTDYIVEEYCEYTAQYGDDAAALIVPTVQAARGITRRILHRREATALYDPRIFTFPTLAETLLDANHTPVSKMSPLHQRLLIHDVIQQLAAQGRLSYPEEVTGLHGFVSATISIIDELKRAAVEPAEFGQIAKRQLPDHPANDDIAAIYEVYQTTLKQRRLYDEAGTFWQARDLLADDQRRPLDNVSLLLVDGFSDFTTTQLQVLRLLCEEMPRCLMTLCLEPDRRQRLFARTRNTERQIENHLGHVCDIDRTWLQPEREADSLAALRHSVFDDANDEPIPDTAQLQILSVPGTVAEVRLIARTIKQLIIDGARPADIAVVLRSTGQYGPVIREVFHEYGIPCEMSAGRPLAEFPVVQAVLDILDVIDGDYRREDIMKLVNSNYVDLQQLGAQDAAAITPDLLEQIALDAGIIGGRRSWGIQFDALSKRLERQRSAAEPAEDGTEEYAAPAAEIEARLEAIALCKSFFDSLSELLGHVGNADNVPEAVGRLGEAIRNLGIPERCYEAGGDGENATAELQALEQLFDLLAELRDAPEAINIDAQRAMGGGFGELLRDLCGQRALRPTYETGGAVQVLDVSTARQLRFRHVFIPGITEDIFPTTAGQDPFYDDNARQRLNEGRIVLEPRLARHDQERFLFYLLVSMATDRLWLSHPTTDPEGHPVLCSQYLDRVGRLLGMAEGERAEGHTGLSRVTVGADEVSCRRELMEVALARVWHGEAAEHLQNARTPSMIEASRRVDQRTFAHVCEAAVAEDDRDSGKPPGKYDGVLWQRNIHAALRGQFGSDHVFSANQFRQYGRCPMHFFFDRVLALEALQEPDEEVEPVEIGNIMHEALSRFFRRREYGTDNCQPLSENELEAEKRHMAEVLNAIFRRWQEDNLLSHFELWRLTLEDLHKDLQTLLEFEVESNQGEPRVVWATELQFGDDGSLVVNCDEEPIRVRGRIDRIDVITGTDPWQFVVLDYKTGRGISKQEIRRGTDFQLPLYCLAAERQDFDGHSVEPGWLAYYEVRRPPRFKAVPGKRYKLPIREAIEIACGYMAEYVEAIRKGRFPVRPEPHSNLCQYCDFADICRYNEARVALKAEIDVAEKQATNGPQADE